MVYTERAETDALSGSRFLWRQRCKYTTSVDIQKRAIKTIHSCRITCECSECSRAESSAIQKRLIIIIINSTSQHVSFSWTRFCTLLLCMVTNIICDCGVIAVAVICVSCHIVVADTVQKWKMSMQPSHTIYINNLNEKIKKDGMLYLYYQLCWKFFFPLHKNLQPRGWEHYLK